MGHRSVLYEMNIDLTTRTWGVSCPINQNLIGPVGYGWDRFNQDPNSMTFGGGLLAGSPLAGTRRMIFCGYSPQWEGFYVSALGGAMYVFHRVGVNYVWLRGICRQNSVLFIRLKNGEYEVRIEPINAEEAWQGYQDSFGRTWEGFYGLQKMVFERYKAEFDGDWMRVLAVGPGAKYTKEGAIGSNQVRRGELSAIDDWAGRGGLGSRLFQYHRVAAIVFGGDWQDPAMKEAKELDLFFLEHFGQRAVKSDLALSQKYRYVPEFETGGTFGVNMHTVDDRLYSFNYKSVYQSDQERLDQHTQYILQHYLKQFNDEIIQPKKFDHCGEPCAVACKKFRGEFKKDYEPYEALGPNCGIFDQRAAEKVNKFVDTMGLDSIQTGGNVAWIMEIIAEKLIPAEDLGLPVEGPRFNFTSNLENNDLIAVSAYNADYALMVIKMILFSEAGKPFRLGMRAAAKWLDEKYGIKSIHRAVYTAHGKDGCMVPNQYWVPGMFAPMPMMGKYFSYYENNFYPPFALGKKNVERFVYELYSENSGSCRFHRKWIEDISDDIIQAHYDLNLDFWEMNFQLAKGIHQYQSGQSVFWESERVVDIVGGFIEKWGRDGLQDPELISWVERFKADKWKAAQDFWQEMYDGMNQTFTDGLKEPPHYEHGFIIE